MPIADSISEADWRHFRHVHGLAVERFSQRVLDEVRKLTSATKKTAHDRYLAQYDLIQLRNQEMADAFNDLRRATARCKILSLCLLALLTEDEVARFSADTKASVQSMLEQQPHPGYYRQR